MTLLLQMNLGFAWGGAVVVDTPATFEVGIEYAAPQGQWHYEVPPAMEMSYSPSDVAWHFDSPTR